MLRTNMFCLFGQTVIYAGTKESSAKEEATACAEA